MINIDNVIVTDCDPIADSKINQWFEEKIKHPHFSGSVYISNQSQLTRLRLAHAKGEVCIKQIEYKGGVITDITYEGMFPWPNDLFGEIEEINSEYLNARIQYSCNQESN